MFSKDAGPIASAPFRNHFGPVLLLAVGGLTGYGLHMGVLASSVQAGEAEVESARSSPQVAPTYPESTLYWSVETLRRAHVELGAVAASREVGVMRAPDVDVQTPTHLLVMLHRRQTDEGAMAELHEELSDFYVITGGSGTIVADGEIENAYELPARPGEFRGRRILNGVTYRVKEGDVMLIPPNIPHQALPDSGGLSYIRLAIKSDAPS